MGAFPRSVIASLSDPPSRSSATRGALVGRLWRGRRCQHASVATPATETPIRVGGGRTRVWERGPCGRCRGAIAGGTDHRADRRAGLAVLPLERPRWPGRQHDRLPGRVVLRRREITGVVGAAARAGLVTAG